MSQRARRYREATEAMDFATLAELRHPDYVCTYPQSGERFVGHDNWAAANADYQGHFGEENRLDVELKGGEQRASVSRALSTMPFGSTPIISVSDTGDLAVLEGVGDWPNGKTYHWVLILEYRDGLVWRETDYFAEPFAAPASRAPFSEPEAPEA
jgi:hypothetical protein